MYKSKKLLGVINAPLPSSVDLTPKCSLVDDQGQLGSCTANALVGALEYLQNKTTGKYLELSRLFIYYNERMIEGDVSQDNGAQIRDGVKSLVKYGVPPEAEWAYNIALFAQKPPVLCYTDALKNVITQYQRVNTLYNKKHCLAQGFPFVLGFTVYDYFESDEMAKTGILKMPQPNEECLGGHAVCAVGYDDKKQMFKIRNSWGTTWGLGGYFWMPYAYVNNPNLCDDCWTITKEGK
jgi:C1A family cysteine protease